MNRTLKKLVTDYRAKNLKKVRVGSNNLDKKYAVDFVSKKDLNLWRKERGSVDQPKNDNIKRN